MASPGPRLADLHAALLSAFPSRADLARMLLFELNVRLEAEIGGDTVSDVVFRLLEWAVSRGRLEELLAAAVRTNPGNVRLREVTGGTAAPHNPATVRSSGGGGNVNIGGSVSGSVIITGNHNQVMTGGSTRAATAPAAERPIDFLIITPLEEERDAVLAQLPGYKRQNPTHDDIRVYFRAEVPVEYPEGSTGTYQVAVVPLLGMGRIEAANATGDAIRRWKPRYVLLVGIAGGLGEAGVALGDVVVSTQIADYEVQKLTTEGTSIRWQVHRVDPRLLGAAQNLLGNEWRDAIRVSRPAPGTPNRKFGVVCTGDKVIANGLLEQYQQVWSKLVAVEMEAGGVASAAFQAAQTPGFFMIRGISDLADAEKDSTAVTAWREYACAAAAGFTVALLRSGPVPEQPSP